MAGDRALFSVIGVLFIRSGTADGEVIGDNPEQLSAGEPRPCQGQAWCQCFARLVTPRLTSQTHWSHVICSSSDPCPCSWWTSQSSEQWTIQEKKVWVFVSHLLPALSVVGWVKGGTRSWQSQPRRNHWQTWVDSLPSPWVNTSNENYTSSALNPLLFFSRRSGCSSVFDWLENPCNLLLYLVRGQDWDEWWQMPAIDHLENYAAWHVETPGLTSQHYTITQVTLQGIIRQ